MQYNKTACLILGVAALTLSSPSFAQATTSNDNGSSSPEISTRISIKHVDQADIDGSAASMEYTEVAAGMEWQFLVLDIDHRSYAWGGSDFLGSNEPFSQLTQIAPGLQYYHEFGNRWSIWAKGLALIGFEDGPSAEAITYNPQIITLYTLTSSLSLYCGAGVLYHPADTTFYPVVGLTWNMKKKKGIFGVLGFPETILRYGLTEQLALKLDILWENRIYQFAEENTVAAEGYIKVEDTLPGLHLEYEPLDDLLLSIGVRHYFERRLTFYNQKEQEMGEHEVESSWASLFKVEYTF
ncbi:MAG: hypothetical protein D3910_00915 [Candidatus Electrothrix sp. ATG2]|nr:hypothetical protein [Candidatus Electrothrix sp. ATG2]